MRRTAKGPRLGVLIGTRALVDIESKRKPVIVRLGRPRRVPGGDWACAYHISRLGSRKIQYAYGIDAIQALLMAIEGIRVALERSGRQFSWAGGEPGTGFTRLVPIAFGLGFARHLEQLIDQEIAQLAQTAEAKSRRA